MSTNTTSWPLFVYPDIIALFTIVNHFETCFLLTKYIQEKLIDYWKDYCSIAQVLNYYRYLYDQVVQTVSSEISNLVATVSDIMPKENRITK